MQELGDGCELLPTTSVIPLQNGIQRPHFIQGCLMRSIKTPHNLSLVFIAFYRCAVNVPEEKGTLDPVLQRDDAESMYST